jgi:hypothetical protein
MDVPLLLLEDPDVVGIEPHPRTLLAEPDVDEREYAIANEAAHLFF